MGCRFKMETGLDDNDDIYIVFGCTILGSILLEAIENEEMKGLVAYEILRV